MLLIKKKKNLHITFIAQNNLNLFSIYFFFEYLFFLVKSRLGLYTVSIAQGQNKNREITNWKETRKKRQEKKWVLVSLGARKGGKKGADWVEWPHFEGIEHSWSARRNREPHQGCGFFFLPLCKNRITPKPLHVALVAETICVTRSHLQTPPPACPHLQPITVSLSPTSSIINNFSLFSRTRLQKDQLSNGALCLFRPGRVRLLASNAESSGSIVCALPSLLFCLVLEQLNL